MALRKLIKDEVTFNVLCTPEYTPVRGNAIATGDPEADRLVEDKILAELNHNPWAWCTVQVTAEWEGFTSQESLGCCSYKNEQDFLDDSYYQDMCDGALEGLNDAMYDLYCKVGELVY